MRLTSIVTSATLVVAATSTLAIAPAEATSPAAATVASRLAPDTDGCVTKREFRRVKKGWSITRVHNLFDTKGKQTYYADGIPALDIPPEQWREYRACVHPRWSTIEVDYEKRDGVWRVSSKYAYWG